MSVTSGYITVVCNYKIPYQVIPRDETHLRVTTLSTVQGTSGCLTMMVRKYSLSTAMDSVGIEVAREIASGDVPSQTDGVC